MISFTVHPAALYRLCSFNIIFWRSVIFFQYEKVPWLPGPLFGFLSVAAGLLVLLLPETLNRPLPQTIEDIEAWSAPKKVKDKDQKDEQELEPVGNDKSDNKVV